LLDPSKSFSPQLNQKKYLKKLPALGDKTKTHGGGGIIYPNAQDRLLDILKSPRANEPLNNKLLHNSRVHSYFRNESANLTPIGGMLIKL
jgi:hypothetical protein